MSEAKVGVTEFVFIPVTEGSKPGEGQEKLFGIQPKGFEGGRYGWQLEDPAVFHWTLNWESLDAHKALMAAPEYGGFVGKITSWASGISLFHAAMTPHPPTAAFESQVTELAKLYLKEGVTKEQFEAGYHKFEVGAKEAAGYRAHAGGWSIEDKDCFVLAIGWESKEAHLAWKVTEAGNKYIGFLREGFEKGEMWHIKDEGAVTTD